VIDVACSAVLFDCDGVLVDSTRSGEAAWAQWATHFGLDPDTVVAGIHGVRSGDTVRTYLPASEWASGLGLIEQLEVESATSTRMIAGADSLMLEAFGAFAIVTSASRRLLRARLAAAGLPTPAVTVTADDVKVGKPHPEPYLRAAHLLGLPIGECVVVEDSVAGIKAARAARARGVLGIGSASASAGVDHAVADLSEVAWTGHGLRLSGERLVVPLRA